MKCIYSMVSSDNMATPSNSLTVALLTDTSIYLLYESWDEMINTLINNNIKITCQLVK